MSNPAGNDVSVTQAQGPPPQYPPPQQPPGYPPQYPPQPGYGPGMPPPMPPAVGPYQSPDIGSTLGDAFELYKNNFMAFFAFWAIPAILAIVLSLAPIAIMGEALGAMDVAPGEEPDFGAIFATLAFLAVFSILSIIINILFTGGVIGMTRKAMETGKTEMGAGFETIRRYFGPILVTSIVTSILIAIGFMLCCIPGILFCYWWMFAVTIAVIEGVGVSEAMSRSKEYAETRHTFWFAVVLLIVIVVISLIASMITGAIAAGIDVALGFWPSQIVSTVIGQVFQWVIAPFATIAVAVHYLKGRGPPPMVQPPPYPGADYPPGPYAPPPQQPYP